MKNKVLYVLTLLSLFSLSMQAQRGVRIGYIDTEYILENVPEYQEATTQLDQKVKDWKLEIEQKLQAVAQKKQSLDNERVLLTRSLYDERLEDLNFEEAEILDYQQKRFGPAGDLMIQKQQLIQPIQDQIFAAIQEIAGSKKYDFIFDKAADVVMLYAAENFDISELVLRSITRSSKRTQASSKAERRAAEQEAIVPDVNPELEARQKALEDKRTERQKEMEARKIAVEARRDSIKSAADARRQQMLLDRENARNATQDDKQNETGVDQKTGSDSKTPAEIAEERRLQRLKEREDRQKELEERRQQILADREKARLEKEQKRQEQKDSAPEKQ